jgi:hypothetical protein
MHSIETIIERQMRRWELQRAISDRAAETRPRPRPVITVSRALGAGGDEIAEKLAGVSRFHLFDRELLDAISRDFGIRERMVELLDDKAQSELESWFLGMMTGRIIDQSDYIRSLTKIVGSLVSFGDAILIGRGTNIIVGPRNGYHIRVVAGRPRRIENVVAAMAVSHREAEGLILGSDASRAHFIKKSFGKDIDDPALYDIVINTDWLELDDATELAFAGYIKKEKNIRKEK